MPITKKVLALCAIALGLIVSGFTIAYWAIVGVLTSLTATGSAIREINEKNLRFDKNMNTMDLDEFICEKKTDSIFSYTCSNGHVKAIDTRKLNEKYEL